MSQKAFVKGANPYMPLWEHVPDGEPRVFTYDGERYVMSGQLSGGTYLRAAGDTKTNYPVRSCRITGLNAGLVYM